MMKLRIWQIILVILYSIRMSELEEPRTGNTLSDRYWQIMLEPPAFFFQRIQLRPNHTITRCFSFPNCCSTKLDAFITLLSSKQLGSRVVPCHCIPFWSHQQIAAWKLLKVSRLSSIECCSLEILVAICLPDPANASDKRFWAVTGERWSVCLHLSILVSNHWYTFAEF